MATLFRLISPQPDHSFDPEIMSSSSRSTNQTHPNQQTYTHFFALDEDHVSPSPSKPYFTFHNGTSPITTPQPSQASCLPSSSTSAKWASTLLTDCARAIVNKDSAQVQRFLWMLNELSSPFGDTDQKLAAYFLQAMFSRVTDSGERTRGALASASEKMCSFDFLRKVVLKFQEVSPWVTFGHAACNGAILEAFQGENNLHILDFSNTYCTQWPTFLEALATRNEDTPHLKITAVVATKHSRAARANASQKVMKEIGNRMEKFARLMGVPFKFNVVYHGGDLSSLNFENVEISNDEALAVNLVGMLHGDLSRDGFLSLIRKMKPKIVTVVEDEADMNVGGDGEDEFMVLFHECLRWFGLYLEALEESFPRMSNERLVLERAAGRAIVDLIACSPEESGERRERAASWCQRFIAAGFAPTAFSEDVGDDVRALLRRHKEEWSTAPCSHGGIFLEWKQQPVVWACAWKA